MDINGFEQVVERYLNGQATNEDLLLIEQWLQQTGNKEYELTAEKKKIIAGRLLPRLKAITQTAAPGARKPLHLFPKRLVRIAAAILVLITTGTLGWIFRQPLADRIAPVAMNTVKAGPYEIKKVQLPDQTMVTLNTGASVSYPVAYRGKQRTATVEGEAFFEIAADKHKPFIVHTPSLDVTVLGTSFVVKEQQHFVTVSVITGKVKVAAAEQSLAALEAGRQVQYNKQSHKAALQPVDIQQVMAWTRHSFSFQEVPLEQVLQAIAQKWNVKLELPGVASGKEFSGDFSNNDSLDDMMAALALATGIHWEKTGTGIIRITYP
ncbi:FecR family protein [Chitinophaga sp. GbtcB8]|uniref:FecR family protein n=1 Tax=Chitinophaga sp. GbtcB8 TaxID=2824753 RepID=UPI001C306BD2|nr:FecR domain-containing protein [Chitinophaga sp. GbtcB8]